MSPDASNTRGRAEAEFSPKIKQTLCNRVCGRCSHPNCDVPTRGPHTDDERDNNLGTASHIHGAAPGSARYDPNQTPEQRKSIANGIWLCRTCGTDVDNDEAHFKADLLRQWKAEAERQATLRLAARTAETDTNGLREATDQLLEWPQTLPDDTWLQRPELDRLLQALNEPEARPHILLGSPGSGKSALLARLGVELRSRGWTVVAIKADYLPREVTSLAKLREHLNLALPVASALYSFARGGNTILLVDQMDALSNLVDVYTERLSVLLKLIHEVTQIEGCRIVCSARKFDFEHDARFEQLDAEPLELPPLEDAQVLDTLRGADIEMNSVPPKLRALLRTVQWLKLFLKLSDRLGGAVPMTWQALLERVWEEKVLHPEADSAQNAVAASEVARRIAEREELWIPKAALTPHHAAIQRLVAAGVLAMPEPGLRVGFSHQTLYEFVRARAFVGEESLADYVMARQSSLFVRPLVWQALRYLREADPQTYSEQLGGLWQADLRPHLRLLLVEFLGQLEAPRDDEAALVLPVLSDPKWVRVALNAMCSSAGWFAQLSKGPLHTIMSGPNRKSASSVLRRAAQRDPEPVFELLERHWAVDLENVDLIIDVLLDVNDWSERTTKILEGLGARGTDTSFDLLVWQLSKKAPSHAVRLLAARMEREFQERRPLLEHTPRPTDDASGAEWGRWYAVREPHNTLTEMLHTASRSHVLRDLAGAAPGPFLARLLPWLSKVVTLIAENDPWHVRYRDEHLLDSRPHHDLPRDLPDSLVIAAQTWAAQEPEQFAKFLREWAKSDLLTVHIYLSFGAEKLASSRSGEALRYLCGDACRMSIGDFQDPDERTLAIIAALAPELDADRTAQLERAIMASAPWSESHDSIGARRDARSMNRRHRLRLLRALSPTLLSPEATRTVDQESRAFPEDPPPGVGFTVAHVIGSPMTAQQMAKAAEDDVVGLFEDLVDSTGFDHPSRMLAGGASQASQEFGKFAAAHPDRALRIIDRLKPVMQEKPVGEAIRSLGEHDFPLPSLCTLIEECDRRGFASSEFREDCARALGKALGRGVVPTSTIVLLERWLDDIPTRERTRPRAKQRNDHPPFLSGSHGGYFLPGGTYSTLRTLRTVLLTRDPPAAAKWLDSLAAHVERDDDPTIWVTLAHDLEALRVCDHAAAAAFLDRLVDRYPEVLEWREGVRLVASASWWAEHGSVRRWAVALLTSTWEHGPYAYGELVGFLGVRSARVEWAQHELTLLLETSGAGGGVVGAANSLAHMWSLAGSRERCTDALLKLLAGGESGVVDAIVGVLAKEDAIVDDDSAAVLRALSAHPGAIAREQGGRAVRWVAELVHAYPKDVTEFCEAIGDHLALTDPGARHNFSGPQALVDLAVTLQRIPAFRERGLDLFERLFDLGLYGAREVLDEVDKGETSARD